MDAAILILTGLSGTCAAVCGALVIAWTSFGRPRHARSWAISFGIAVAQLAVNMAGILLGRPEPVMIVALLLAALTGPAFAIGVRQRARLPSRRRRFLAAYAVEAFGLIVFAAIPATRPLALGSATLFSAACLLLAAATARRTRIQSGAADVMFVVSLLVLAIVEAATGVLTAAAMTPAAAHGADLAYRAVFVLALPPAIAFAGVAAVLVLGSDLAAELGRLASRDPLTGLFNRRGFQENAERSLANTRRLGMRATLAICDIDHFKAVNDRYGHTAGDRALEFVATRLATGVRQGDLVARTGGEEFALLLFGSTPAEAHEVVERIRIAIAPGVEWDGDRVALTASFGVAEILLGPGEMETLIARAFERADRALYLSKTGGRDRTTVLVDA